MPTNGVPNQALTGIVELSRYRIDQMEEKVIKDHEPRIRALESMSAKIAMAATLGSLLGGGLVVAVVEFLLKR